MKRGLFSFLIAISVLAACAISLGSYIVIQDGWLRRPKNPRAALIGEYRFQWKEGSSCSEQDLESSTLELLGDGTSEQRDRFKDGSEFVTPSTWEYYEYHRWCPALSCDLIAFQKLRVTTDLEIKKNVSPSGAGLIVRWSKPPKIILRSWSDCFFAKVH